MSNGRPCWCAWRDGKNTIEMRLHSGTVHPTKARAWLEVCNEIGHLLRGDNLEYLDRAARLETPPWRLLSGFPAEYLEARHAAGGVFHLSIPETI